MLYNDLGDDIWAILVVGRPHEWIDRVGNELVELCIVSWITREFDDLFLNLIESLFIDCWCC